MFVLAGFVSQSQGIGDGGWAHCSWLRSPELNASCTTLDITSLGYSRSARPFTTVLGFQVSRPVLPVGCAVECTYCSAELVLAGMQSKYRPLPTGEKW